MVIIVVAVYTIQSVQHRLKGCTPDQFILGRDMIILIKYIEYWKLIHKRDQTHINYDNSTKMKACYTMTTK